MIPPDARLGAQPVLTRYVEDPGGELAFWVMTTPTCVLSGKRRTEN